MSAETAQAAPDPPKRIKNTIRCANELCKLPLAEMPNKSTLIPLHARPELRLKYGVLSVDLTCPGCGTARTVTVQR